MASASLNVLRWSALAFGSIYGLTHQRTLNSAAASAAEQKQYDHQEELLVKAKAAWNKKQSRRGIISGLFGSDDEDSGSGGKTLDDKDFDLDSWLKSV